LALRAWVDLIPDLIYFPILEVPEIEPTLTTQSIDILSIIT
jgi:hypothetical protein